MWAHRTPDFGFSSSPSSGTDNPLLPTPSPFHLGNTEDPAAWQERRLDVLRRTGTYVGPSLPVIARSVVEGAPLLPGGYMPDVLLPTPTAQDGANHGGPSQYRRNSLPLNAVAPLIGTPDELFPPGEQLAIPMPGDIDWGPFSPAIRLWESVLGRPAPPPMETGPNDILQMSAAFGEWVMGLPVGWITDIPGINYRRQWTALGNGVVPKQAAWALTVMEGGQ